VIERIEARAAPGSLDLLDPRLRLLCDAYLEAAQVPGASIAVVAGDRGYHYAYGIKSTLTGEPVTAGTSFNIGSCSKAFVSAAVASLVAEGLVAWDDPISRWVPELQLYDPEVTRQVTLRDLSANRLGLPRVGLTEFGLDPAFPPEHVLARLRHTAPAYAFRDRFTYVNAGHIANAVAVGRINGKSFLATLCERILAPLGMTSTSGGAAAGRELSNLAAWHCLVDGKVVAIDAVFTDVYLGAGGMVVSGADAVQWLRLHLGGGMVDGRQVIAREALLETHRAHSVARPGKEFVGLFYPDAHTGAYALGWAVSDFEGHPLVCHSGNDLGCAAMTMLLPRSGIGIAIYANATGHTTVALAYAIAACLLGLAPRDWKAYFDAALAQVSGPAPEEAEPEPPADLSVYAGVYEHPADGPLVVERRGDALAGQLRDGYRWEFILAAAGGHRFTVRFVHPEWQASLPTALDFTVAGGRVTKVELQRWPVARVFHPRELA